MESFTRTYALIHLEAIRQNILETRKRVGDGTKIMAIVKANAYGHGADKVAAYIKNDVYGFAVATVREAVALRECGIKNPILILGYVCKAEYETVILNDIRFSLLTKEMAEEVSSCAKLLGRSAKCHVKVDTGMNRIGFPANDDGIRRIAEAVSYPGLCCEGIFMHFATADEADKSYAAKQFNRFLQVMEALKERGVTFPIRHCANSAAIIDLPQYRLDMVREGIILYGLRPSDDVDQNIVCHPALELKSHVIFVKDLEAGEGISYGRTYITDRPVKVATVAIGYADGYPRSLSSKGYVLIHGKKARILGRICMDQMMVDVTDIENVQVEDVVTVIGKDGDAQIRCEELGALSGRFHYELLCGLSERVERKYVK